LGRYKYSAIVTKYVVEIIIWSKEIYNKYFSRKKYRYLGDRSVEEMIKVLLKRYKCGIARRISIY